MISSDLPARDCTRSIHSTGPLAPSVPSRELRRPYPLLPPSLRPTPRCCVRGGTCVLAEFLLSRGHAELRSFVPGRPRQSLRRAPARSSPRGGGRSPWLSDGPP